MKKIKIPKNSTLSGIVLSNESFVGYYDTNNIVKIEDNSHGRKGTPDYYIYFDDKEIDELYSLSIINIPFKDFSKKLKFL